MSVRACSCRWIVAPLVAVCAAMCAVVVLPASAVALSEGRVYERVSPAFKGGYGANAIAAAAPDGERVAFLSQGVFAGAGTGPTFNGYLARRTPAGWSTVPLGPPASVLPYVLFESPTDYSGTLESSLTLGSQGPNSGWGQYESSENVFLLHSSDAPYLPEAFEVAGEVLKSPHGEPLRPLVLYEGASPDFAHIVFFTGGTIPLLPEAEGVTLPIYDLVVSGAGAPSLRLVAVKNKDGRHGEPKPMDPECKPELGVVLSSGARRRFNAIAADGSEIFFSVHVVDGECNLNGYEQLYVRLSGARTVEVSRPVSEACSEVPCPKAAQRATAIFQGASEDGARVFFTAGLGEAGPLVPGDTDASENLYMATIGCRAGEGRACEGEPEQTDTTSLTELSHDPNGGEAAEVQGVVAIGAEGGYVYFVAHGSLSGANSEGHTPIKGADNLYVADTGTGGAPQFITELCSGPEESGEVEDTRCPASVAEGREARNDTNLWLAAAPEAQTAAGGRFLVFSSYGRLTVDDTDSARDVFRYDAATGVLQRVSLGEADFDANGNGLEPSAGAYDASITVVPLGQAEVFVQQRLDSRAISADGSRIVFTSAEPLSEDATNGLENIYVWHELPGSSQATVSLISSGSSPESDKEPVISASGRDIFFVTAAGLVAQDTDGAQDVYDARIGGGFPAAPAAQAPCAGDACQGPLSTPAPLLVPGSATQTPGENASAAKAKRSKGKANGSSRSRKARARRLARALRACHRKPKHRRAGCIRRARRRYGRQSARHRRGHAQRRRHGGAGRRG